MCGKQLPGNKSFPREQNVNTAMNRNVIMLLDSKQDCKSEPITYSIKAFLRNLLKRTSRLPVDTAWARSHRILQPEPWAVPCMPGRVWRPGESCQGRANVLTHQSSSGRGTRKMTLPL